MRVLVTGGTGYVGAAVVRTLAARGHAPVVFARSASRSGLPGALVDGDVRDAPAVERAARGCDAICHMAALVSIWRRRSQDFDDVNVGGLKHVLEAAAAARVERTVYTSSFLALRPHDAASPIEANDYQRTKIIADRIATSAIGQGAPIVRVYPGVVYGPGASTEGNLVGRLISDHLAGRLPGIVGADRKWSCAYVDDVARGHCAALERGQVGGSYVLGGENASLGAIFEVVTTICGRAAPRRIPFPVATAIALVEEARARWSAHAPLITRGAIEIFRHDWSLDSGASVAQLGYSMTPLVDGVRRTIESIRGIAQPA